MELLGKRLSTLMRFSACNLEANAVEERRMSLFWDELEMRGKVK